MLCRSMECWSFLTATRQACSLRASRAVCLLRSTAFGVLVLALAAEKAPAITIDVTQLTGPGFAITSEYGLKPARSTRTRPLRCRRPETPPERCFWQKKRNFGCCALGGSARSGDSSAGDIGASGVHSGAPGGSGGSGAGGGGGRGGGGNSGTASSFIPVIDQEVLPPVSSVPGPTAGVGVPGLLLFGCALFGWWIRRRNGQVNAGA